MLRVSGKRKTNINRSSINREESWNRRGQLFYFYSPYSTPVCHEESKKNEKEKECKGREYKVLFFGSDSVSLPTLQLLHSLFLLSNNNTDNNCNNIDNNVDNTVNNAKNNKENGNKIGREWIENNDTLKELLSTTIKNSYLIDDNNKENNNKEEGMKGGCRISHLSVICPPDTIHKPGVVKRYAKENGITFYQPDDLNAWMEEKENEEKVGEIDVGVVVSFGYFIPKKMIEKMKYGGINMHPSELPYYRGAAPLYYQLLFSDPSAAISVITLDPDRFDHGKVLLQWKFVIGYRISSSIYFPFAAEFGAMGILRSLSHLPLLLSSSPSQSLLLSHYKKTTSEKPFHYDNRSINHLIAHSSSLPPPPIPPSISSLPSFIADLNEISKITNGMADLVRKQHDHNNNEDNDYHDRYFNKEQQKYGEKEVEVMVKRKKENVLFFPKTAEEYPAISRALSEMSNDDRSLIEQERNEVMARLGKGMRIFNSPKIVREMAEIKWSFFPSPLLIFSMFKSFSSSFLSNVNPFYVYTYFYRAPTKEGKEGTWIKVKWIDLSPISYPLLFQLDDNQMKMKNGQAIFDKGKSNHLFVWFSFHPSLSLHFPISFNHKSIPFLSLLPSHFSLYHSSSHHPSDHIININIDNNVGREERKEEEKEEERKGWWMEVKKLQVEGGKVLTAREFANSYFSKSSPFFFSELPPHLSSSSN